MIHIVMTSEFSNTNQERLAQVIKIILDTKASGKFIFEPQTSDPEKPFVELLIRYGERIKNSNFATNALFLTSGLVRGNKTNHFFGKKLTNEFVFDRFAWIFEPDQVVNRKKEDVVDACCTYFKPAGYCIKAIDNWQYNCQIIQNHGGCIKTIFDGFGGDAEQSAKFVYFRNRAKSWEKIKAGTFLNYGEHLAYLAIQWLSLYGLYDFKNIENLPIDFQLSRISIQTDVYLPTGYENVNRVITKVLMPIFRDVCKQMGVDPREVSQAFWRFGSDACNRKLHSQCPLKDLCVRYLTSKSYQADGTLSALDEGRHKNTSQFFQPKLW